MSTATVSKQHKSDVIKQQATTNNTPVNLLTDKCINKSINLITYFTNHSVIQHHSGTALLGGFDLSLCVLARWCMKLLMNGIVFMVDALYFKKVQ